MKKIAILGSTGSIGTQALDLCRRHPDRYRVAALTARGVEPLCVARFTRRAADLVFADGTVCELAGDVGRLGGGGKEEALCEVEIELKSGDAGVAEAFARELQARFGLREEPRSKFARAAALTKE